MTTDKRGIAALLLQRQLGRGCYETAWMMLHKFRQAMGNLGREPLRGKVEVDDTWIGRTQAGLQGSRQLKGRKAALVIVALEKRGKGLRTHTDAGHPGIQKRHSQWVRPAQCSSSEPITA